MRLSHVPRLLLAFGFLAGLRVVRSGQRAVAFRAALAFLATVRLVRSGERAVGFAAGLAFLGTVRLVHARPSAARIVRPALVALALAAALLVAPFRPGAPTPGGPAPLDELAQEAAVLAPAPEAAAAAGSEEAGAAGQQGRRISSTTARRPSLEPEDLTGYRWPMRPRARITTWFAPTDHGFVVIDGQRVHDGIDLATFCGDHVRAAHDGRVLYAGRRFDRYLGYSGPLEPFYARLKERKLPMTVLPIVVVVDDENGYLSAYVHLMRASVRRGDRVRAGQVIGREGATGRASGCHLHYMLIRLDGGWQRVAPDAVRKLRYPPLVRERVDPLRVLSLADPGAPRRVPGIPPPKVSPGSRPPAPDPGPERMPPLGQTDQR